MELLKKAGVVIAAGLTLGFGPVVPEKMDLSHCYQSTYEGQFVLNHEPAVASTSVDTSAEPRPIFEDEDKNGMVSICVFSDHKENKVSIQIPDEQYAAMGEVEGEKRNPKKEEFLTLFDAFAPKKAEAAVAFDATATSYVLTATSLTYSFNNVAGDVVVQGVSAFGGQTVTGITYAGAALTKAGSFLQGGFDDAEIWYKASPSTGANNVVITMSASTAEIIGGSTSFTGSGGTVSAAVTSSGTDSLNDSMEATVSCATDSMTMDTIAVQFLGTSIAAGAGQTSRWNNAIARVGAGSTEAGASSVTMSWDQTLGTGDQWAYAVVCVGTPPAAAVQTDSDMMILE